MNIGLVPIRNFGIVMPDVYRSAQPMYRYEYKWLRDKLGIKTIINLRKESRHDKIARGLGIKVINISVPDHFAPTLQQVNVFKKHIEPHTLFHCEHGHGRTSSFSVITSLLSGKSFEEAIRIERMKFGYEFKHQKQLNFLKNLTLEKIK